MTKIIVRVDDPTGHAATCPAFINGKAIDYPINQPFEASDDLLAVLRDSDLTVETLSEGGSQSDAATDSEGAAVDHGGAGGAKPSNPLDHDGDGEPGGSKPAAERSLEDLAAEAEALGVKVDKRWGEKRLRTEIAKATPANQSTTKE